MRPPKKHILCGLREYQKNIVSNDSTHNTIAYIIQMLPGKT